MYVLGQGVVRNDITGYAWLKVAAETLFPGYQKIVHQLEEAMTPEQRVLADARARQTIDLYGRAATNMSCSQNASRGGLRHRFDRVHAAPRRQYDAAQAMHGYAVAVTAAPTHSRCRAAASAAASSRTTGYKPTRCAVNQGERW